MGKNVIAAFLVLAVLAWVVFMRIRLDTLVVSTKAWKYSDDEPGLWTHHDFIHFDTGTFEIKDDTLFLFDTAVARVGFAYRWIDGRCKLRLHALNGSRVVEYVDI